jgi:cytoskeletal protein CcmA (bactofilin family)
VVIGATTSNTEYLEASASQVYGDTDVEKTVDADDARLYGDVDAGKTVNLQNGTITGDATSAGADVKLTNGTVDGTVTAGAGIDVQKGSSVGGDLVSDNNKTVDLDDSTVDGDVMSKETVDLNGVTVEGDVYASDFKCTDSTVGGESCDEYSPKSPSDW